MGNKNKTISFRVSQEKFETLREMAEERDLSLSAVFRNYVDMLVAHDGQVEVVPEHEVSEDAGDGASFPPKVEVPKSFVREHERLELEAEHLREQLQEHKEYVTRLRQELDDHEDGEDVVHLEELDGEDEETDPSYRIGSSFDDAA
ncbi:MAG: CopG family transcriptional regulator [Halorientalis sp.]